MTCAKSNIIQYPPKQKRRQTVTSCLPTAALAKVGTRENVTGNNFLYNGGTELNTTTNVYDLFFRNYDPALDHMNACLPKRLRRHGVDPMARKYASLTPYNYSFNDPVTFTDPNGADPEGYWEGAEPIFEQYTMRMYSPTYGWLQDDVIYQRIVGWRGPGARYAGPGLDWMFGKAGIGPASGGHWAVGLRSVSENFALLSGSAFGALYNTANLSDSERFNMALAMSQRPSESDLSYIAAALGAKGMEVSGNNVWMTVNLEQAVYAGGLEAENQIRMGTYGVINFSIGVGKKHLLSALRSHYRQQQTQGNGPNGWNQFWIGFAGSQNSTDFSSATTVTSTALFWVDGVGSSVKYSARTFGELRNAVRAEKFFKPLGVVGGIVTTSMTAYDATQDGSISNGDWFKIGAGVLQVGLAFTPVGWGVLAYNGVDLLVGITTGTSVTDRIANGIDKIGK
ncbi:MAG: hypothetical protein HRU69_11325 [Flammeovirgaceae bacterium]|nr:MAG: hypothetical protein HRU69_11325 [Flammeovirgaceae bacterium]